MIVITRSRSRAKPTVHVDNVPTPEKIREMTAKIRQSWTPRERRRRANILGYVELAQMPLQPRRKGFWGD